MMTGLHEQHSETGSRQTACEPWRPFFAVLLAYLVVQYLLIPHNTIFAFPVHHDDYNNLAYTFHSLVWCPIRPVSHAIIMLLAAMGRHVFYLALHALLLGYLSMVLIFICELLQLRRPRFALLMLLALAAVSFEHTLQYYKYTGMITNLLSAVFGTGSMLCLLSAFRHPNAWKRRLTAGLLLAMLSMFSKEDFILPLMLLCLYFGLFAPLIFGKKCLVATRTAALMSLLCASVFLYNHWAENPYTTTQTGTYAADFAPASIARTMLIYLTTPSLPLIASGGQLLALAAAMLWRSRVNWPLFLLLQTIVFVLILPYACLPHHVHPFYIQMWIAWQFGMLLAFSPCLERLSPRVRLTAISAAIGMSIAIVSFTQKSRLLVAAWYQQEVTINRAMIKTVRDNAGLLRDFPIVGVTGAPVLGPWFNTDGGFLAGHCGVDRDWVVFAQKDSDYCRIARELSGTNIHGRVTTRDVAEMPRFPGIPVLALRPDGTGTVLLNNKDPKTADAAPAR